VQLLTTTRVYGPEDETNPDFLKLIQNPPAGIVILDGNAGLGADWPAGIWKSANAAAIAIALISAPSTIEENLPKWKEIYDYVSQAMVDFHGEFRIDRDTAQILAMEKAVFSHRMNSDRLEVHMAIRHYFSSYPGYEDLLRKERIDMDWPETGEFGSEEFSRGVQSNEEAARQARCRYLFGLSDDRKCITICVEGDGSILFEKEMNMDANWG